MSPSCPRQLSMKLEPTKKGVCEGKGFAEFCQTLLFSHIKHLFCFKNGQNRRFNLWNCAVSGCARKCPQWILSVFMQFDEGLDDLWTVVGNFWAIFDRLWNIFDPILGRSPGPEPSPGSQAAFPTAPATHAPSQHHSVYFEKRWNLHIRSWLRVLPWSVRCGGGGGGQKVRVRGAR